MRTSSTIDEKTVGSVHVWVHRISKRLLRSADEEFRDQFLPGYGIRHGAGRSCLLRASGSCSRACSGEPHQPHDQEPPKPSRRATCRRARSCTAKTRSRELGETFDAMADSIEQRPASLERRLTTDVAHELRTPLMAIQSTVEAMVDGVFEADEERLETVNSEVQRLSRLVDAHSQAVASRKPLHSHERRRSSTSASLFEGIAGHVA